MPKSTSQTPCGKCLACLTTQSSPIESAPEANSAATGEPPPARASKATWVDHAVTQGFDRAEAEAMSKRELVASFTEEKD
jgi:hypothetical protein